MRVRLLAQIRDDARSGEVVDLPEAEAAGLIQVGYAVAVEDPAVVPTGKADVIKAWVGADPEKALAAIEAERIRARPRSTLIADLEEIVEDEPVEG